LARRRRRRSAAAAAAPPSPADPPPPPSPVAAADDDDGVAVAVISIGGDGMTGDGMRRRYAWECVNSNSNWSKSTSPAAVLLISPNECQVKAKELWSIFCCCC
jgi:hypothetical protein